MVIKEELTLQLRADEIIGIVRQMRNSGYQIGVDFDYYYIPASYKDDEWVPSRGKFVFYVEELSTWFALKCL